MQKHVGVADNNPPISSHFSRILPKLGPGWRFGSPHGLPGALLDLTAQSPGYPVATVGAVIIEDQHGIREAEAAREYPFQVLVRLVLHEQRSY